jgi:hypothetical protein
MNHKRLVLALFTLLLLDTPLLGGSDNGRGGLTVYGAGTSILTGGGPGTAPVITKLGFRFENGPAGSTVWRSRRVQRPGPLAAVSSTIMYAGKDSNPTGQKMRASGPLFFRSSARLLPSFSHWDADLPALCLETNIGPKRFGLRGGPYENEREVRHESI